MKIAVISDTHGKVDLVIGAIKKELNIDRIIHLGDCTDDIGRIEIETNLPVVAVRGNCDLLDDYTPLERFFEIEGIKILAVHGHKYNVKYSQERLYFRALELGANIVLYGHSHVFSIEKARGIYMINPGSPTLPRSQHGKTYVLLELEDGQIYTEMKVL